MQYALFDWDNTVRDGYTLFSWTDYLIDNHILPNRLRDEYRKYLRQYNGKAITHDDLAKITCKLFAHELKGIKQAVLAEAARQYHEFDKRHIFPFSGSLFTLLSQKNICAIIVSGAPRMIIEAYRKPYSLFDIYSFEPELRNGVFSGNVSGNYGYAKERAVEEITQKYGRCPLFSFGDAQSDEPLLEAAKVGFVIGDAGKMRQHYVTIHPTDNPQTVTELISGYI